MTTEKPQVEVKLLQQPSGRDIFPLLKLPSELRDIIYRHSIAAGNTGILRVNKLVKEEASEFPSKHAVLRLNFSSALNNHIKAEFVRSIPMASIQRVEFRLNTSPGARELPLNIVPFISDFYGSPPTRESCVVTINYGKEVPVPRDFMFNRFYDQLSRVGGFRALIVKSVVEKHEFAESKGSLLLTEEQSLEAFSFDSRLLESHRESYQTVRKFLELSLGPAKFDDSVEGH